jgi:16S rRNA (guanine966-N2)-methyltransferase
LAVGKASPGGGQLRITGGRFRGRRLQVPSRTGLRPTTDRTRETLFNWLAPSIEGSRCLDCFAGSGALGFEAASRGAAEVVLIEQAGVVARQLRLVAAELGADAVTVIVTDALRWLASTPPRRFDVVFLDPPFGHGLLRPACALLHRRGWVGADSLIYIESADIDGLPSLPEGWELLRQKSAGQVRYGLAGVRAAAPR